MNWLSSATAVVSSHLERGVGDKHDVGSLRGMNRRIYDARRPPSAPVQHKQHAVSVNLDLGGGGLGAPSLKIKGGENASQLRVHVA